MRYKYYESDKILGHLYRAVDEQKIWREDVQSKVRPLGDSFWDEFLRVMRPRYEALTGNSTSWVAHMDTAREIRTWYQESIASAMMQYSAHPSKPITELEVFIGNVLNRSGVQTNRQRDTSIKLGEEFDRVSVWITKMMRSVSHDDISGYQTQFDNLHLCYACVCAGGKWKPITVAERRQGRDFADMQSFRVVAACALMAELRTFETGHAGGGGGGYVGVRGDGL